MKLSHWLYPEFDEYGDPVESSANYGGMPFAEQLAAELMDCVCRISIEVANGIDSIPNGTETAVYCGRSAGEVERLIEWVSTLEYGPSSEVALGSPCDDETGSDIGPFANAVRFFEEQRSPENPGKTPWTGYYLVGTSSDQEELRATRGNLVAALGLAKMDRALLRWQQGDAKGSLANLGMAWRCALVATVLNQHHLTAHYFVHRLPTLQATARAKSRHLKDPKQVAKKFVFECWRDWRRRPDQYPSIAAFARAMLDKMPEELTSEVVVSRWVRAWQKDFA